MKTQQKWKQTERSFQAPWPVIRMGCGFATQVNAVCVKGGSDVEFELFKHGRLPSQLILERICARQ